MAVDVISVTFFNGVMTSFLGLVRAMIFQSGTSDLPQNNQVFWDFFHVRSPRLRWVIGRQ